MGVISSDKLKDRQGLFQHLILNSISRGKDSAGILAVERRKDSTFFFVEKDALHPWDFLRTQNVGRILRDDTNNALLGHVRHATIGKVEKATAHPYEINDIVGFHNGTIRGYKEASDLTDSSRFYTRVSKIGFKAALEELPEESAYAFVFFDKSNDTYHLFRNKKRELWIVLSEDLKTMLYASEERFLRATLAHCGMMEKFGSPYLLDTNTLLHVRLRDTLEFEVQKDYIEKSMIEKHETTKTYGSYGVWDGTYWRGSQNTTGTTTRSGNTGGTGTHRPFQAQAEKRSAEIIAFGRTKNSRGKIEYPYSTFQYDPTVDAVIRHIFMGPSSNKKSWFYRSNVQFDTMYTLTKAYMLNTLGGCFIELDEDTYDFIIHLPVDKRGKRRQKRILANDPRWDGYWYVRDHMDTIWEQQVIEDSTMNIKEFVPPYDIVYDWNKMHSEASRMAQKPKKRDESKETKGTKDEKTPTTKEINEAFDTLDVALAAREKEDLEWEDRDKIPFDGDHEDPYYQIFHEELDLKEAGKRLYAGCMNCIEQSTVNDVVFWTGPRTYICHPCSGLQMVQNSVNMDQAVRGRLVTPVFQATEVLQ